MGRTAKHRGRKTFTVSRLPFSSSAREPFEDRKMETKYLTPKEVAELLNIKPRTLETWRLRGHPLKFHKLGPKTVRYTEADVIAFANRDVRTSTSQQPRQLASV